MADGGRDVVVRVAERRAESAASSSSSAHASNSREQEENEEEEEEEDCWADMLEGTAYPELFSPGGCITKDVGAMSPRLYQQATTQRGPMSSFFLRGAPGLKCSSFGHERS